MHDGHNDSFTMQVACNQNSRLFTLFRTIHSPPAIPLSPKVIVSMSTSRPDRASILEAALESYRRKTKNDLASHPLFSTLQYCDSPEAILSVFREHIPINDRLTEWVITTVNVLHAFSGTLSQVVGLVNIRTSCREGVSILIFIFQSPMNLIFTGIGVLLSVSVLMDSWDS